MFLQRSLLFFLISPGSYFLKTDVSVMSRRQNQGVQLTLTSGAQLISDLGTLGGGRGPLFLRVVLSLELQGV